MFDFFDMVGTHETRKVDHYEKDKLTIDTCMVTDSDKPYETAVSHPKYNSGNWVIVELYSTITEAQIGHDKWVGIMTANELPKILKDVSTANCAEMADAFNNKGEDWRDMPITE